MRKSITQLKHVVLWVYHKTHWFTDREAWGVFRFFAILEAVGWSMLILAIIYRRLGLPEAPSVISFAGHMHGLIMGVYYIITLLAARSMEWGIGRIVVALLAGIPPYGTIAFEQYMAWYRKKYPKIIQPPKGLEE